MTMDTSQGDLEEEEAISGAGEGDDIMEEVEEGYSTFSLLGNRGRAVSPCSLLASGAWHLMRPCCIC